MKSEDSNIFHDKTFKNGVSWNLVSLFIMGISGLLMNMCIARYYEPWALGVFNNVYAIYIIFTQVGSLGVHQSVIRHIPIFSKDKYQSSQIIISALIITITSSLCVALITYVLRTPLSLAFNDIRIKPALYYLLIGLLLFPINKVLIATLNGFRIMHFLAIAQSLRYIFILASLIFMVKSKQPGENLSLVFSIAEIFLLLILILMTKKYIVFGKDKGLALWIPKHIKFGIKGMIGGILNGLNIRLDILILSIFISMESVGIFSLAATIPEGMSLILMVFRLNYDPLIAKYVYSQDWDNLRLMISKGKKSIILFTILLSILTILLYPIIIKYLLNSDKFHQSQLIFIILTLGVVFSSGFTPFGSILQQGGYPGTQTLLTIIVVLINLIGNLILLPRYGLIGTAFSTTASQIAYVYILKYLTGKKVRKGLL